MTKNTTSLYIQHFLKAFVDKVGAVLGIVVLSPFFVILYLLIRKDGGPAFYGHTRIGKNGKSFKCWKFRSMVSNADKMLESHLKKNPQARIEWEKDFKLKCDPRITATGHFIRKTSLDEIPQLYNVLCGEMSLVGPRPIVDDEKHYYGDSLPLYLSVKPGITGLWQISGRNDTSYDERVSLDSWYAKNWTVRNDMIIMLKTVSVVLLRKGAY